MTVVEGSDGTESFLGGRLGTLGQQILMLILDNPFKQLKTPTLLSLYNMRVPKDM